MSKCFRLFIFLVFLGATACNKAVPVIGSESASSGIPFVNASLDRSSPTNATSLSVFGSCSDDKPFVTGGIHICIKQGGCSWPADFLYSAACASGTYNFAIPLGGFSTDGIYDVEVLAIDDDGNSSPFAGSTITVDRTAPSAPTGLSVTSPGDVQNPAVTVSGVSAGDTVDLYFGAGCPGSVQGSKVSTGTTVALALAPTTSLTSVGSYTIYAKTTDSAGNSSACSTASVGYTYNTTVPNVTNTLSVSSDYESVSSATFTINLSAPTGHTVSVDYGTSNGTAIAGFDYTATSGTVTFLPGETSKTVSVTIIDDNLVEPNETMWLGITNPVNCVITGAAAQYTIINDDLGAFTIQGVEGASDIVTDANLNGGLSPKIRWSLSSGATSYDVSILQNDGVTDACGGVQNVPDPATVFYFSSCTLTAGLTYKAKVVAKVGATTLPASNNLFSFFVNRAPVATNDTYFIPYNAGAVTLSGSIARPESNDTDADGDPLTITAFSYSGTNGSMTISAGVFTYTPNLGFHGIDSFTYTVSDTHGGSAVGSVILKVVAPGTWLGGPWATPASWCGGANAARSSCGAGAIPSIASSVFIDNISNTVLTIPSATISDMDVAPSYTSTITLGGALTLNGGAGLTLRGGTLSIGSNALNISGPLIMGGAGAAGIFAGGTGIVNINGSFNLGANASFSSTTGNLKVAGAANISAGTFIHNNGTFELSSSVGGNRFHNIAPGTVFRNFQLTTTGPVGAFNFGASTFNVLGNLIFNASVRGNQLNNTTINFSGPAVTYTNFGYGGDGLIRFVGASAQSLSGAPSPLILPSVEIAMATGTLSLSTYNYIIDGDYIFTSGALNAGTSTVQFGDNLYPLGIDTIISSDLSTWFFNVNFNGTTSNTHFISGSLNALGTLTIGSSFAGGESFSGGTINAGGDVSFTNQGAHGPTDLMFVGTAAQNLSITSANVFGGTFKVSNSGGPINLTSNVMVPGPGLTLIGGSIQMHGFSLAVPGVLDVQTGTSITKGGGVLSYGSLTGTGTINP